MTQSRSTLRPPLFPHPQNWDSTEDLFSLQGPFLLQFPTALEAAARLLNQALSPFGECRMNPEKREEGPVIKLECKEEEAEESYNLKICENHIRICGSASGVFHGVATLRQLLLQVKDLKNPTLQGAVIRDYPRYAWRGVLLDCSRHFFSFF